MQNNTSLAKELAKECRSMDDIHGYPKHDPSGNNSGNSRNGYSKKTIKTRLGNTEIDIPRDRNGEFEPQILKFFYFLYTI